MTKTIEKKDRNENELNSIFIVISIFKQSLFDIKKTVNRGKIIFF